MVLTTVIKISTILSYRSYFYARIHHIFIQTLKINSGKQNLSCKGVRTTSSTADTSLT